MTVFIYFYKLLSNLTFAQLINQRVRNREPIKVLFLVIRCIIEFFIL